MEFIREGGSKNLVGQSGVDVYIKATDRAEYKIGKKGQRTYDVPVHSSEDIVTISGADDGDRIWISAIGGRAAWSYDASELVGPLDDPDDITIEELKGAIGSGGGSGGGISAQTTVTGFGDSITAFVNSFVHWFVRDSSETFTYKLNAGIPGNTTAQMLERIETDLPEDTQVVTVMETANDAGQRVDAITHATNVKVILENLLGRGFTPIFVLGPPKTGDQDLLQEYNEYDFFTCQELGVTCLDPWSQFSNPLDGDWAAGTDADGVHPTVETEQAAGVTMSQDLKNKNFASLLPRDSTNGTLSNSMFTQTFGGRPSFWTDTGMNTKVTAPDAAFALGNTFDYNVASSSLSTFYRPNIEVNDGETYLITCIVQATKNSGNTKFSAYTSYGAGGARNYAIQDAQVDVGRTVISLEFIADRDTTDLRFYLTTDSADAAAYDIDVRFAQFQMYNKTSRTI